MRRRQAKKIYRRWLLGTPYRETPHGREYLPPYHSLVRYRRTTFREAALIVGLEEIRNNARPGRRPFKWKPYEL